jgi:hypothetical protein
MRGIAFTAFCGRSVAALFRALEKDPARRGVL